MYSVVGSDGQVYGPVDMATLSQWIAEGRVTPTTNLIDPLDGRVIPAGSAPALMGNFPNLPPQAPPTSGYATPTNPYQMGGMGLGPSASSPLAGYPRNDLGTYYGPPKTKVVAVLLALFLGGLGLHRFYLGHTAIGIVMLAMSLVGLALCGIPNIIVGVWIIVDIVMVLTGSLREANGRALA